MATQVSWLPILKFEILTVIHIDFLSFIKTAFLAYNMRFAIATLRFSKVQLTPCASCIKYLYYFSTFLSFAERHFLATWILDDNARDEAPELRTIQHNPKHPEEKPQSSAREQKTKMKMNTNILASSQLDEQLPHERNNWNAWCFFLHPSPLL